VTLVAEVAIVRAVVGGYSGRNEERRIIEIDGRLPMPDAHDVSVGVFVRGLTNLKAQLTKAEDHAVATGSGEATLLDAQLAANGGVRVPGVPGNASNDLHTYTLAAHVHWSAEGARLAIAHLLGAPFGPATTDAKSFAELHQRVDATITHLQDVARSDLEAGLDRTVAIEHRHGSVRSTGAQFLLAFAIPHFFYHVTTAYGIMRNEGVQLTMGDFLGNWTTP
jgi:hypothetical protein